MTNKIFYLDNPEVTLTSYQLDKSPEFSNIKNRPSVLIFPGGGYSMLSDRESEPIAMGYLSRGYNAFILNYSIGKDKKWPMPLHDAEQALKLIRNNALEFNIDPEKIAVIGFSAGGHLAAALGCMGEIRPTTLILGYPCILETLNNILAFPVPGIDQEVDHRTPPSFIFTSYEDRVVTVDHILSFTENLNKKSIPFELHIFKSGQHGLSLATEQTCSGNTKLIDRNMAKWFDLSCCWLENLWGSVGSFYTENKK